MRTILQSMQSSALDSPKICTQKLQRKNAVKTLTISFEENKFLANFVTNSDYCIKQCGNSGAPGRGDISTLFRNLASIARFFVFRE